MGPCPGSGNLAQTSFVIEDGAIAEWRRVALPGEQDSGQTTYNAPFLTPETRI